MGPTPLGGSCERGKVPSTWEPPLLAQRSAGTYGELEWLRICSRGWCGSWLAARQGREGPAQMVAAVSPHFPAHDAHLLVHAVAGW